jgi:hypothetical protein
MDRGIRLADLGTTADRRNALLHYYQMTIYGVSE